MARLIAFEHGSDRLRLVVAAERGGRFVVEHSLSLPCVEHGKIKPGDEDPAAPQPSEAGSVLAEPAGGLNCGKVLAAALAELGIGRHEAIVAVGRDQVELRQMSLPPSPDDELPELVRFQASREFHQFDENWLFDYIPLTDDPAQPREVLAAALAPETAAEFRSVCAAAGLELKRLVLRPCATASLVLRGGLLDDAKLTLLIDPAEESVDLTAWTGGRAVFMRTARLPAGESDDDDRRLVLLGEIRRTLAAVQNQLDGRRVESLLVVGSPIDHALLIRTLGEAFDAPVTAFDPQSQVEFSVRLKQQPPPQPERYAALWGALADELGGGRPTIDFLHPRRRPSPPSRRRQYILAGSAICVILFGWFFFQRLQRNWLESELADLNEQLKTANVQVERAQKLDAKVREIEKWTAEDIVWLDELHRLSKSFPPAKEAMLRQMSLATGPRGGEIKIEGFAQADAIARLHEAPHESGHRVVEKDSAKDSSQKYYDWKFSASVLVTPEKKK